MSPQDKAECLVALSGMRQASKTFYGNAVNVGHHQFIEFTGLINEYIGICEEAFAAGHDFRNHSLKPKSFQREYMAEKIDCIFAGSVQLVAGQS